MSISAGLNYSNLEAAGAPAAPDLALNRQERKASGAGVFYADEYNQAAQNAYNNAYNYWLWQQQMEYNSPKAQVQRLKEAGLNPNFNSIEGTGNASSIPASNASTKGNVVSSKLNAIGTAVNVATGIAGAVSKGVQALKAFASTPVAIRQYRKLLYGMGLSKNTLLGIESALKEIQLESEGVLRGNQPGNVLPNIENSIWFRSKLAGVDLAEKRVAFQDTLNAIKEWEKDSLNPQKLDNLKASYENLVAGTALRNMEIKWKNPKEIVGMLKVILPVAGYLFTKFL